jgi:hypothetical protein
MWILLSLVSLMYPWILSIYSDKLCAPFSSKRAFFFNKMFVYIIVTYFPVSFSFFRTDTSIVYSYNSKITFKKNVSNQRTSGSLIIGRVFSWSRRRTKNLKSTKRKFGYKTRTFPNLSDNPSEQNINNHL